MSKYRAADYLRLSYTENHENESDSLSLIHIFYIFRLVSGE